VDNVFTVPQSCPAATTSGQLVNLGQVTAGFQPIGSYAALAGNAAQAFSVAPSAVSTNNAVPRNQADTLYAGVAGNAAQVFSVASSTAGTNNAVPRNQADALYAGVAGNAAHVFSVGFATANTQAPELGQVLIATHFGYNPATTTGLTFGYLAGAVRSGGTVTAVAAGTVALTASTTNYIQVSGAGVVSVNTTGFTSGIPLWTVVTGASAITSWTDMRTALLSVSGYTIPFTTLVDQTANRAGGTNYTNTGVLPMYVTVLPSVSTVGSGYYVQFTVTSGGVSESARSYPPYTGAGPGGYISVLVPPGGTYSLTLAGSGTAIYKWYEIQ
jgi:hypothetical protein